MVDKFILEAVKETSKEYKEIPDFDKICEEHAEKVETFLKEMLHTSRPAKQKEPEGIWMMTQDPELPKDVFEIIKKPERINTLESGHCIVFGVTGAGMTYTLHEQAVRELSEELSKKGCKEVKIRKDE